MNKYIFLHYSTHRDFLLLVSHFFFTCIFALGMDGAWSWHALAGLTHLVHILHTSSLPSPPLSSFLTLSPACSLHVPGMHRQRHHLLFAYEAWSCVCTCAVHVLLCYNCVNVCMHFVFVLQMWEHCVLSLDYRLYITFKGSRQNEQHSACTNTHNQC